MLDYGGVIYKHAFASTLKPLDTVYYSAVRFITADFYSAHHSSFMGEKNKQTAQPDKITTDNIDSCMLLSIHY